MTFVCFSLYVVKVLRSINASFITFLFFYLHSFFLLLSLPFSLQLSISFLLSSSFYDTYFLVRDVFCRLQRGLTNSLFAEVY
jgi:hypothetical protein